MTVAAIESIRAREVFDSRGRPTVEALIRLRNGTEARASVPSGASTGSHEAHELRDGDRSRHNGLGVLKAVANINDHIGPVLRGLDIFDQRRIDQSLIELDGTADKRRLGANAILAASLVAVRCAAHASDRQLWQQLLGPGEQALIPMPMINMISGGLHATRMLDFQDFMIIPISAQSFTEALDISFKIRWALRERILSTGGSVLLADEGGFSPRLRNNREALELLMEAISLAGLQPGRDAAIAIDVASTHLYDPANSSYRLALENRVLSSDELIEMFIEWVSEFPIVSIEDPLHEDDWDGWTRLTSRLGSQIQLLGDDLFTTNPGRLRQGTDCGAGNAILIKMNQIGTISETMDVVAQARQAGYRTVISARSGETEDAALADLAVGSRGGQLKVGSLACMERLCKYNRVLEIEDSIETDSCFATARNLRLTDKV